MTKTKKINNMNKKHTRKNKYTKKAPKLKKRVKKSNKIFRKTRKFLKKRGFRKRKTVRKIKRGGDNDDCIIEGVIEKNKVANDDECLMCAASLKGLKNGKTDNLTDTDIRGGIIYQMKTCGQKFHAQCVLDWMKLKQHKTPLENYDTIKCPGGCNYSNIDQNTYMYIFAFIGSNEHGSRLYNGGKYFTPEYLGDYEQIADFINPSRDSTTRAPPPPPAPDSTTPPPPPSDSNCVIMG